MCCCWAVRRSTRTLTSSSIRRRGLTERGSIGASSIFSASEDLKRSNIHHAGYVSDDDLAALYKGALCLAFPSKTEGFGITLLEEMARGCPVISSNAASLAEVGGDAVIYVDPGDGHGWREAIIGLSQNEALCRTMAAQGKKSSPGGAARNCTSRRSASVPGGDPASRRS
jgi:glycosyltransferase involved in cell wall biosynthesis